MANTLPFKIPDEWGIDEDALQSEWDAMQAYEPKSLPESSALLTKLLSEVADAIAFMIEVAKTLKSDCRAIEDAVELAQAAGLDWTAELDFPEPTELNLQARLRLDKVHEYLDGPGYFWFQFLRRMGERIRESEKAFKKALVNPNDRRRWLVFLLPQVDQAMADETCLKVLQNIVRVNLNGEIQKVSLTISSLVAHYRKLEHGIEAKIENQVYLRGGWKRPSDWVNVWKQYGDAISESTFYRLRRDGKIRCHPDSTQMRVAIHFDDLPNDYQDYLREVPP